MTVNYSYIYTIAVGLIIIGLSVRFGGEQFLTDYYAKKYNEEVGSTLIKTLKYVGVGLYVFGWLIVSVCLALKNRGNALLRNSIFGSMLVCLLWVVFEFKPTPERSSDIFIYNPKLPLIACSVLISSMCSLIVFKRDLKDIFLIVIASILITGSEYFILPFQREHNIVDGIGLPLIILGWIILWSVFKSDDGPLKNLIRQNDGMIPLVTINK